MMLEKVKQLSSSFSSFDPAHKKQLGFLPVPDKELIKKFIAKGRWPILITDTNEKYRLAHGFRIMPDVSSKFWPIYELTHINTAFLYAPSMTAYLNFIHYEIIRMLKGRHEKFQSDWSLYEDGILPYYQHFGGDNLDELKEYSFNSKYWPEENLGELKDEDYIYFMRKHSDIAEVDYMVNLVNKLNEDNNYIPTLPKIELGIWKNRIMNIIGARAAIKATSDMPSEKVEVQIFEHFKQPHGYDTEDVSVRIRPNDSATASNQYFNVADGHIANPNYKHVSGIVEQPEFKVLLAIKEQGMGYMGVEHIEAAAVLDDQLNEPMRAWNCLLSAGYWAGLNKPELQETIMEAAIYLCRKHNWTEAADAVQYNLDIYRN